METNTEGLVIEIGSLYARLPGLQGRIIILDVLYLIMKEICLQLIKSAQTSPFSLLKYRELLWEMTRRELSQRYRGSFLGAVWSLIIPLLMLLIYTFVFGVVFKAKWAGVNPNLPPEQFALILFAGIAPFTVFSEVANRAPTLVITSPNYVKKVIFPLEVLPVVSLLVALINSLISLIMIIVANLVIMHTISSTLFLVPLAYLPLTFLSLMAGWLLSSLGVYIRDIGQGIGVVVQVLYFVSPVFYSIESVPARLQPILALNPLSTIIQGFRQVLLWGQPLPWSSWALWTVITLIGAFLAYVWFVKTKKGFADVL